MSPLLPTWRFLVASGLAVTPLLGQEPAASASPAAPTPAAERPRAISPAIASRLAEQMPKFTPPPPAEKSPVLAEARATAPAREPDRPRNTIIRLPNYVVREEKPEAFKERHLLTPHGRLSLALKRYPGLRFGSLPFLSNQGLALFMLAEDERLERKAEMEELVSVLTTAADRAQGKTELQKTFLRTDWLPGHR